MSSVRPIPSSIADKDDKLREMAMLLLQCRDALPAITVTRARLHNVSNSLGTRIEGCLEPWRCDDDDPEGV